MKRIFIACLVAIAGSANASGCFDSAHKFATMLNNMHTLGYSAQRIERELLSAGTEVVSVGVAYYRILNNQPKGGWTSSEYVRFASNFASGACKK